MKGKFKVKHITAMDSVALGQEFPESDYSTLTPEGNFVQLEYIEGDEEVEPFNVTPGIYTINKDMSGLVLEKTSFVKDDILEDFVNTQEIEGKADCFFRNTHKYKEFGIEVATRKMLLYGPPGTGKTTSLAKVCNKYVADGKTMVLIFPTEKFEAFHVKDFIKRFNYQGVEKLILVMEDVGGVEMEEVRRSSDSGLLSLLDNQEKTLTIPTLVIATTNFPEVFMGNLTNRPGRFDDKIRAGYPESKARVRLFEFFSKVKSSEPLIAILIGKDAKDLSPAHLKEIVIRAAIHEKTHEVAANEVIQEIKDYQKAFSEKGKGLGFDSYS